MIYDRVSARKTRESILTILSELIESPSFEDRSDKKWIFATAANCHFSLSENEKGEESEGRFFALLPAEWEVKTYCDNKINTLNFVKKD